MDFKELNLWCMVMLPLIFSPGPANIAVASVSSVSGFRAAMIFACGVSLVSGTVLSLMGFGMGLMYVKYRTFFQILEHIGAAYIIYLGLKILRAKLPSSSEAGGEKKVLGVRDAFLLQGLNAKMYPTLTMMFSQFIGGETPTGSKVLLLSGLMLGMSFLSYIIWGWLGLAMGRSKKAWSFWIQRYGFGGLLLLVGVWLLFH